MIGNRIKQVRLASGLTLEELVDRLQDYGLSLSKQALSNYETGKRTPKASILMAIAKSLNVKSSFLMSEPTISIEWISFRCEETLGLRLAESLLAISESQAEPQLILQQILTPQIKPKFPKKRKVESLEDAEKAAMDLRNSWNLGLAPIDSLTIAIENHGGIVVYIPFDGEGFDGLAGISDMKYPVISVNANVPDDRKRFSLAHELGHLIMDTEDFCWEHEDKFANRFAASFLVPKKTVFEEVGNLRKNFGLEELGLLKKKYGMSIQAWILRMRDLEIITPYAAAMAYSEIDQKNWRKKEPIEYVGNETPVKLKQMTHRALSEGIITQEKAEELCPGIMGNTIIDETQASKEPSKPSELMKLSRSERQKILNKLASKTERLYQEDEELAEFEAMKEDDIYD